MSLSLQSFICQKGVWDMLKKEIKEIHAKGNERKKMHAKEHDKKLYKSHAKNMKKRERRKEKDSPYFQRQPT